MECEKCQNDFDLNMRRPKVLGNCGHTLCQNCINELQNDTDEDVFTCPLDQTEYAVGGNFMDNMILIKCLKKNRKVRVYDHQNWAMGSY